jgi:DNA-directed RNA polymerase subunit M/transcription elongation factor TFIIS
MQRLKQRRKKVLSTRKKRPIKKPKPTTKKRVNEKLLKYLEEKGLNDKKFQQLSKEDLYLKLLSLESPQKDEPVIDFEINNILKTDIERESFIPCPICGSKLTDIKIRRSTSTDEGDFQVIICRECKKTSTKR